LLSKVLSSFLSNPAGGETGGRDQAAATLPERGTASPIIADYSIPILT